MKLSVIICVYNTQRETFERCLNSVCTSTLKDYEVVVIDDGSVVDYSDIIEKYHPVYIKTSNRGCLAARTYGLMVAQGEYVAYLDSDDTVTFNYYQPMVDFAVDSGADIVVNDWAFKTASTYAYCKNDSTISGNLDLIGDEILRQFAKHQGRQHSYYVLWNKVFKKELLLTAKGEIEKTDAIMKSMTYSEDMLINFFAFKYAKKLKNIHTGYYFYHIHNDQIITADSGEKITLQAEQFNVSIEIMQRSVGQGKYAEEISENLAEWRRLMCRTHYSNAIAIKDEALCSSIKEVYKAEKLSKSTFKDSRDYITSGLLGENFEGIDKILRFIYKKREGVSVNYDKSDTYIEASLRYIEKENGVSLPYSKTAQIVIPKRKNSLKTRVLHMSPVMSLGMILFPKGSKLRRVFKSKL